MRVTSARASLPRPTGRGRLRPAAALWLIAEPERAARELRLVAPTRRLGPALQKGMGSLLGRSRGCPTRSARSSGSSRLRAGRGTHAAKAARARSRSREALLWALGGSPFLAEQVIRHPRVGRVADAPARAGERPRPSGSPPRLAARSRAAARSARDALRLLRRREVLRIAIRDLLRLTSVSGTLASLSALADGLVEAALEVVAGELGEPRRARERPRRARRVRCALALCARSRRRAQLQPDVDPSMHRSTPAPRRARRARTGARPPAHGSARGHHRRGPCVYRVDLRLRPEGGPARSPTRCSPPPSTTLARRNPGAPRSAHGAAARGRPRRRSRAAAPGRALRLEPAVRTRRGRGGAAAQARERPGAPPRGSLENRHVKLGRGGIREIELVAQVLQIRAAGRLRSHARAARSSHSRVSSERGRLPRRRTGGSRERTCSCARREISCRWRTTPPDPRAPDDEHGPRCWRRGWATGAAAARRRPASERSPAAIGRGARRLRLVLGAAAHEPKRLRRTARRLAAARHVGQEPVCGGGPVRPRAAEALRQKAAPPGAAGQQQVCARCPTMRERVRDAPPEDVGCPQPRRVARHRSSPRPAGGPGPASVDGGAQSADGGARARSEGTAPRTRPRPARGAVLDVAAAGCGTSLATPALAAGGERVRAVPRPRPDEGKCARVDLRR